MLQAPSGWGQPPHNRILDGPNNINPFPTYGQTYSAPRDAFADGVQRTQQPIVTGTSVLALTYKDGIMMAADTLSSYGSLARFKDTERLVQVGGFTVVGAGGDMSDFQFLKRQLNEIILDEEINAADGHRLGPAEIHECLNNYQYKRRCELNPLWNTLLVGGFKDGKKFLAYSDLIGTSFTAPTLATGFGAHLAQPLLRTAVEGRENELTEEQALEIMENCMRVLFYRDARSINKFQIATISEAGVKISEPRSVKTEWSFAEGIRGYGAQTQ